jgi:hypothetical protein
MLFIHNLIYLNAENISFIFQILGCFTKIYNLVFNRFFLKLVLDLPDGLLSDQFGCLSRKVAFVGSGCEFTKLILWYMIFSSLFDRKYEYQY